MTLRSTTITAVMATALLLPWSAVSPSVSQAATVSAATASAVRPCAAAKRAYQRQVRFAKATYQAEIRATRRSYLRSNRTAGDRRRLKALKIDSRQALRAGNKRARILLAAAC